MSSGQATRGRGVVATALTAVADWLVEPVGPHAAPPELVEVEVMRRPVIAVAGLAPRSGTTVVARAIGVALAARARGGAGAVTAAGTGPLSVGLPAAGRLARALAPMAPGGTRAVGRLCLVRGADPAELSAGVHGLAPLVIDVTEAADAAVATSLADGVVLVAAPEAEPALARVVADNLAAIGSAPVIVVNRGRSDLEAWTAVGDVVLPESRMAARAALAGREGRGVFGDAIAGLVDRLVNP